MISSDSIVRQDEIDLIVLVRVVWELKYAIVLITAIFGIAAVVLALTATEVFRAEAVVVEVSEGNMGGAASLASQFGGLASLAGVNISTGGGAGQEALAILKSRRLAEEFIQRGDLLAELAPSGSESPTLWLAVKRFRESVLRIHEDANEGVTKVIIEWTEPTTAARWANGFVGLANDLIRTRALEEAKRNIHYLDEQIEQTNVVEVQRVMYNLIENETKTLMLANARAEYAFRIVDPAVPPEVRSSPKRKLMVASGVVLGLFVGMIFVLAYNLVRRLRMNE